MARHFRIEEWKAFPISHKLRFNYAISNYGRVKSFTDDIRAGQILKGGIVGGYPVFNYKIYGGPKVKTKNLYIHHLVAKFFLPEKTDGHEFIIHLDHNKENNHVDNISWATKAEWVEHSKTSPLVIAAKQKLQFNQVRDGHKLTVTEVLRIKKKLFDPNRKTRLKIIAKQFGVSEMTLYRIKSGENWSHIKLE